MEAVKVAQWFLPKVVEVLMLPTRLVSLQSKLL